MRVEKGIKPTFRLLEIFLAFRLLPDTEFKVGLNISCLSILGDKKVTRLSLDIGGIFEKIIANISDRLSAEFSAVQ